MSWATSIGWASIGEMIAQQPADVRRAFGHLLLGRQRDGLVLLTNHIGRWNISPRYGREPLGNDGVARWLQAFDGHGSIVEQSRGAAGLRLPRLAIQRCVPANRVALADREPLSTSVVRGRRRVSAGFVVDS